MATVFAVQCHGCDVGLLASSVWRLAPQETVEKAAGSCGGVESEGARSLRTAVKPPTPLTGPSRRAKARSGRGGAESEASGPKAATLGKHVCARAPGWPDVCGRWCDGQRTKEQRGARTPAHAKVGGAMVLAGQACCRFSRRAQVQAPSRLVNRQFGVRGPVPVSDGAVRRGIACQLSLEVSSTGIRSADGRKREGRRRRRVEGKCARAHRC